MSLFSFKYRTFCQKRVWYNEQQCVVHLEHAHHLGTEEDLHE